MKDFIGACAIGFFRALLPFSFVIALVLCPSMWFRPRDWPDIFMQMWDDPL